MAVSSPTIKTSITPSHGIRPVNLRTDLAPLADLIELVFADTMDSGGRAALREMRALSKFGPGLNVLARMNDMAQGISLGYVWVEDGQLIGNVSVYPASWPQSFGQTYIIANVDVHPDYRGHGIARQLMQQSMQMIASKGGKRAILQVDEDNTHARTLYKTLDFVDERTFITWRRSSSGVIPSPAQVDNAFIRHRRRSEWQRERQLAEEIRPQWQGGLGWMRPLHGQYFKRGFWRSLNDMVNLRGIERMVVEDSDRQYKGSLWIETAITGRTQLTLLVPNANRGIYDDLLLNNVVKRYGRSVLVCEHPADDVISAGVLKRYRFAQQRNVVHMRWDV